MTTTISGSDRFEREVDMYPPLQAAASRLFDVDQEADWCSFRDYPVLYRAPDMLLCRVNWSALDRRIEAGQSRPLSRLEIRILRNLRSDRASSLDVALAGLATQERRCRRALGALVRQKYVVQEGRAAYRRAERLQPVIEYTISFEAKLSDWSKALVQVQSHVLHSDRVYVVFDSAYRERFKRVQDRFERLQVGLLALDASAKTPLFQSVLKPKKPRRSSPLLRALVSEQLLPELIRLRSSPATSSR